MAELSVDKVYADALFQVAREQGVEKILSEETQELVDIFFENNDLLKLLEDPSISKEEKKRLVEKLFGEKISAYLLNLLYILIDKKRINRFNYIVKAYKQCIAEEHGYSAGRVITAIPLGKTQIEAIEAETTKLLKRTIKLENELDPTLIGGLKIFVDGKVIDASLRKQIDNLKIELL
ncbi:MAG: ATP synthase F1 subunit delta [Anaerovoracaceae bacterium]